MNTLRYAVRLPTVLKYFGQLCMVLAVMTVVPLGVSLATRDFTVSLRYTIVIAGVFSLGFGLNRLRAARKIQTNEAMVTSALIFLFAPLVMAWPTMASGLGFLDAFFETISAITTTGLTTTATMQGKPTAFLFARAWMQWIGGLGILVLSLAVVIHPGTMAKRLGDLEDYEDDLSGSTRANARRILIVYAGITAVGVLGLGLLNGSWFDAVLYAFSAVSTGGFSPTDAGIAGLQNLWTQFYVILISMAGGISLVLYIRAYRDGWKVVAKDRQIHGLVTAGMAASLIIAGLLCANSGLHWSDALIHGTMNALSAQSTAGFSSMDISGIDSGSKVVLMFSMLIGGSAGSTAGGIKILRFLIILRLLHTLILRAGSSKQAVIEPRLSGRKIETDEINNAACIVLLFFLFIAFSWLPFVVWGYDPLDSLFDVVSAIGTVGLSAGVTGPTLQPFLKCILAADMLLGRLEILVWLVLLAPGTWFGKRMEA